MKKIILKTALEEVAYKYATERIESFTKDHKGEVFINPKAYENIMVQFMDGARWENKRCIEKIRSYLKTYFEANGMKPFKMASILSEIGKYIEDK